MTEAGTTDEPRLRIIFIEDRPLDEELARQILQRDGLAFSSVCVETEAAFREAFEAGRPDLVISDYTMPKWDGMSALRLVRELDPFLPFIVLTGSINETTAVACMKAGANDYVLKEQNSRLPFAVREALASRESRRMASENERRLEESEERYRSIFQGTGAPVLLVEPETATVFDANRAACLFFGWKGGSAAGSSLASFVPESATWIQKSIDNASARKQTSFHLVHRARASGDRDLEIHASQLMIGGSELVYLIIHDVADQVRAEKEREALAERLTHYLSTSPTITYAFRIEGGKTHWQWVSDNVERMLGYTPAEALEADWWLSRVHPDHRKGAILGISQLVRKDSLTREYLFLLKGKRSVWLRDSLRILRKEEGVAEVVGTLTDISDEKKSQQELILKSAALEAAANAVVITDREGSIQWVNEAFSKLTGYTRDESTGKNPRELVKSGEQDKNVYRLLWETIAAGEVWRGRIVNRKKDGELYPEEMTITPVYDRPGHIANFVAIKTDITEREKDRRRLEAMNEQNVALVREVHHRVNNNMQIISSLLNLSMRGGGGEETERSIRDIDRRIQSMALIHEQFYDSDDFARIDFSLSIRNIGDFIREDHPITAMQIAIGYEMESVILGLESAIPAGLLVAEFIGNAFSHAFKVEGQGGTISIVMRIAADSLVEIVVRDDGIGLPQGFSIEEATSLGMVFIAGLVKQLKGEIEFVGNAGTAVTLRFPLTGEEGRFPDQRE